MLEELRGFNDGPQHYYNSIKASFGDDEAQSKTTISTTLIEDILHKPRLDALLDCDANIISYDPFSFAMVFGLRGRNLRMIRAPLMILLLWDMCWALTLTLEEHPNGTMFIASSKGLISPLLTPISFLLVFRLGRAAVRFWDSRAAFGKLVEICRDVMSTAAVSCKNNRRRDLHDDFARWICAFPIATKNFLRPDLPCSRDGRSRRREIGPLLSDKDAGDVLTPVNGGGSMEFIAPIYVLDRIRELAFLLSFDGECSNGSTALQAQKGIAIYQHLNRQIDTLNGAWGAMERIAATPLPFVYVVHLRTFLLLYLFLWNLQGIESNGWPSIPALLAASWALLGIEAAAVECERPYQLHSNHLPLGKMCVVVAKNVVQTIKTVGWYDHD
mmetsp:Transcript_17624/g.42427  ORF Transcript_17624/g.42427 Transcript_17624/m.42427 type:complete len:386 (-) Transcript_17624:1798-2955(-)